MTLTQEQVSEAVQQVKSHCDMLMDQYKAGVGEYATVSARSVLNTLGYEADADQILRFMASKGFSYCLDPSIPHNDSYPPPHACWWGADQLESRISFFW